MNKRNLDCLLYVGVHVDSVNAAKSAIMDIIRSSNGDSVKQEALVTLREMCKVGNTSITNSNFSG